MSTTLVDTRRALADAVTVVPGFDYLPGRLVPPCVIVLPGSPYLTSGDVFGELAVSYRLVTIFGGTNNETASRELDQLVEDVMGDLHPDYVVEEVSDPYGLEANNAQYAATDLTVSTTICL